MPIKKNKQKVNPSPVESAPTVIQPTETELVIDEASIKAQQSLDKLKRQKNGYPDTEILEAGAIEQWLEDRKIQLLEEANSTRTHSGIAGWGGLAVSFAGFVLTGSAMAGIAPFIIGAGVVGYAASLLDTKSAINKIFPIPLLNLSPSTLVQQLSPDLRGVGDRPEEYERLDYLPVEKARELAMLTDFQGMVIQLLERVETGKRFAIYQVLRQAAEKYSFKDSAKQIAAAVNKNIDAIAVDPTLDQEVVTSIQQRINPPEPVEVEVVSEPVDNLNFSLPLDEVRLEELEAANQHKPEDLINEFASEPRNTLVIGAGGTGKGILISNLLRAFKSANPDYFVIVFDPKGDSKEKGYFEGCVDKLCVCESLGKTPQYKHRKYEEMWNIFYEELQQRGSKILLVIDEATTMGITYQLVNKTNDLKSKIADLPNLGGSSAVYNWIIAQNSHVSDLGVNKGIQNNYTRLGLISLKKGEGQSSFATMRQTKFITNSKYTWDDVRVTAEKSPRKRAFYFSKFECWLSMPEMKNYSGFDRDAGKMLPQSAPTKLQSETPTQLQGEKDEIELVFDALIAAPTNDIREAIRSANPEVEESVIDDVILKIRMQAIARNNRPLLDKFFPA